MGRTRTTVVSMTTTQHDDEEEAGMMTTRASGCAQIGRGRGSDDGEGEGHEFEGGEGDDKERGWKSRAMRTTARRRGEGGGATSMPAMYTIKHRVSNEQTHHNFNAIGVPTVYDVDTHGGMRSHCVEPSNKSRSGCTS